MFPECKRTTIKLESHPTRNHEKQICRTQRWAKSSLTTSALEHQKKRRLLLNYLHSVYVRQSFGDVVRKVSPLLHINCFTSKADWPQAGFRFVQAAGAKGGSKIVKRSTQMRAGRMRSFIPRKRLTPIPRPRFTPSLQFFLLSCKMKWLSTQ
jgi:hypothetical protein